MNIIDQLKQAHKNGQTIEVTKRNGEKLKGEVKSVSSDCSKPRSLRDSILRYSM